MEWPGWTPNGALLRDFQSFFLDGEDGRSSVGLRQNVGKRVETHFSSVTEQNFCKTIAKSPRTTTLTCTDSRIPTESAAVSQC